MSNIRGVSTKNLTKKQGQIYGISQRDLMVQYYNTAKEQMHEFIQKEQKQYDNLISEELKKLGGKNEIFGILGIPFTTAKTLSKFGLNMVTGAIQLITGFANNGWEMIKSFSEKDFNKGLKDLEYLVVDLGANLVFGTTTSLLGLAADIGYSFGADPSWAYDEQKGIIPKIDNLATEVRIQALRNEDEKGFAPLQLSPGQLDPYTKAKYKEEIDAKRWQKDDGSKNWAAETIHWTKDFNKAFAKNIDNIYDTTFKYTFGFGKSYEERAGLSKVNQFLHPVAETVGNIIPIILAAKFGGAMGISQSALSTAGSLMFASSVYASSMEQALDNGASLTDAQTYSYGKMVTTLAAERAIGQILPGAQKIKSVDWQKAVTKIGGRVAIATAHAYSQRGLDYYGGGENKIPEETRQSLNERVAYSALQGLISGTAFTVGDYLIYNVAKGVDPKIERTQRAYMAKNLKQIQKVLKEVEKNVNTEDMWGRSYNEKIKADPLVSMFFIEDSQGNLSLSFTGEQVLNAEDLFAIQGDEVITKKTHAVGSDEFLKKHVEEIIYKDKDGNTQKRKVRIAPKGITKKLVNGKVIESLFDKNVRFAIVYVEGDIITDKDGNQYVYIGEGKGERNNFIPLEEAQKIVKERESPVGGTEALVERPSLPFNKELSFNSYTDQDGFMYINAASKDGVFNLISHEVNDFLFNAVGNNKTTKKQAKAYKKVLKEVEKLVEEYEISPEGEKSLLEKLGVKFPFEKYHALYEFDSDYSAKMTREVMSAIIQQTFDNKRIIKSTFGIKNNLFSRIADILKSGLLKKEATSYFGLDPVKDAELIRILNSMQSNLTEAFKENKMYIQNEHALLSYLQRQALIMHTGGAFSFSQEDADEKAKMKEEMFPLIREKFDWEKRFHYLALEGKYPLSVPEYRKFLNMQKEVNEAYTSDSYEVFREKEHKLIEATEEKAREMITKFSVHAKNYLFNSDFNFFIEKYFSKKDFSLLTDKQSRRLILYDTFYREKALKGEGESHHLRDSFISHLHDYFNAIEAQLSPFKPNFKKEEISTPVEIYMLRAFGEDYDDMLKEVSKRYFETAEGVLLDEIKRHELEIKQAEQTGNIIAKHEATTNLDYLLEKIYSTPRDLGKTNFHLFNPRIEYELAKYYLEGFPTLEEKEVEELRSLNEAFKKAPDQPGRERDESRKLFRQFRVRENKRRYKAIQKKAIATRGIQILAHDWLADTKLPEKFKKAILKEGFTTADIINNPQILAVFIEEAILRAVESGEVLPEDVEYEIYTKETHQKEWQEGKILKINGHYFFQEQFENIHPNLFLSKLHFNIMNYSFQTFLFPKIQRTNGPLKDFYYLTEIHPIYITKNGEKIYDARVNSSSIGSVQVEYLLKHGVLPNQSFALQSYSNRISTTKFFGPIELIFKKDILKRKDTVVTQEDVFVPKVYYKSTDVPYSLMPSFSGSFIWADDGYQTKIQMPEEYEQEPSFENTDVMKMREYILENRHVFLSRYQRTGELLFDGLLEDIIEEGENIYPDLKMHLRYLIFASMDKDSPHLSIEEIQAQKARSRDLSVDLVSIFQDGLEAYTELLEYFPVGAPIAGMYVDDEAPYDIKDFLKIINSKFAEARNLPAPKLDEDLAYEYEEFQESFDLVIEMLKRVDYSTEKVLVAEGITTIKTDDIGAIIFNREKIRHDIIFEFENKEQRLKNYIKELEQDPSLDNVGLRKLREAKKELKFFLENKQDEIDKQFEKTMANIKKIEESIKDGATIHDDEEFEDWYQNEKNPDDFVFSFDGDSDLDAESIRRKVAEAQYREKAKGAKYNKDGEPINNAGEVLTTSEIELLNHTYDYDKEFNSGSYLFYPAYKEFEEKRMDLITEYWEKHNSGEPIHSFEIKTPERKKAIGKIVKKELKKMKSVKKEKKLSIVITRPSSGISLAEQVAKHNNAYLVDQYKTQEKLPGFNPTIQSLFFVEGYKLKNALYKGALKQGSNIVYNTYTERGEEQEKLVNTILEAKEKGYKVNVYYNEVSAETSERISTRELVLDKKEKEPETHHTPSYNPGAVYEKMKHNTLDKRITDIQGYYKQSNEVKEGTSPMYIESGGKIDNVVSFVKAMKLTTPEKAEHLEKAKPKEVALKTKKELPTVDEAIESPEKAVETKKQVTKSNFTKRVIDKKGTKIVKNGHVDARRSYRKVTKQEYKDQDAEFTKNHDEIKKIVNKPRGAVQRTISKLYKSWEVEMNRGRRTGKFYNYLGIQTARAIINELYVLDKLMRNDPTRKDKELTIIELDNIVQKVNDAIFSVMKYVDEEITLEINKSEENPEGFAYTKAIHWYLRKLQAPEEWSQKLDDEMMKERAGHPYRELIASIFGYNEKGGQERLARALGNFVRYSDVDSIMDLYGDKPATVKTTVERWEKELKQSYSISKLINFSPSANAFLDVFTVGEAAGLFKEGSPYHVLNEKLVNATTNKLIVEQKTRSFWGKDKFMEKNYKKIKNLDNNKNSIPIKNLNGAKLRPSQVINAYAMALREIVRNRAIDLGIIQGEKTHHFRLNNEIIIPSNDLFKDVKLDKGKIVTMGEPIELLKELGEIIKNDSFLNEYYQKSVEYLNLMYPYVNERYKEIHGAKLLNDGEIIKEAVQNDVELQNKLKEGLGINTKQLYSLYIPLMVDQSSFFKADKTSFDGYMNLSVFKGMTEDLGDSDGRIIVDSITNVMANYGHRVANYYGMHRVVENFNDLLSQNLPGYDQTTNLTRFMPKKIETYYRKLLESMAGYKKPSSMQGTERGLNWFKTNFYRAALVGNFKVISSQTTTLINMAFNWGHEPFHVMYPKLISSFFTSFSKKNKEDIKYLYANSPIFADRAKLGTFEIGEATRSGFLGTNKFNKLLDKGMAGIKFMDTRINIALYLYFLNTKNPKTGVNYTRDEAIKMVETAIVRGQSSTTAVSRSTALRNENPIIRMFLRFFGEPNKRISEAYNSVQELDFIRKIEKEKDAIKEEADRKIKEKEKELHKAIEEHENLERQENAETFNNFSEKEQKKIHNARKRAEKIRTQKEKEFEQVKEEAKEWKEFVDEKTSEGYRKEAFRRARGRFGAFITNIIYMTMLGFGFNMLRTKGGKTERSREEDFATYLLRQLGDGMIDNTLGMFPIARNVKSVVLSGWDFNAIPELQSINDLGKSMNYIYNALAKGDNVNWHKTSNNIATSLGQTFGIPVRQIDRLISTPLLYIDESGYYKYQEFRGKRQAVNKTLARAIEKGDDRLIETVVKSKIESRNVVVSNPSMSEITRLTKVGHEVRISGIRDSYTVDGITYKLSSVKKAEFAKVYNNADMIVRKMIQSREYRRLNDDMKRSILTSIYTYYYNKAKQDVLDVDLIAEKNYFRTLREAYSYFVKRAESLYRQQQSDSYKQRIKDKERKLQEVGKSKKKRVV